jgi:hypothetical protein
VFCYSGGVKNCQLALFNEPPTPTLPAFPLLASADPKEISHLYQVPAGNHYPQAQTRRHNIGRARVPPTANAGTALVHSSDMLVGFCADLGGEQFVEEVGVTNPPFFAACSRRAVSDRADRARPELRALAGNHPTLTRRDDFENRLRELLAKSR